MNTNPLITKISKLPPANWFYFARAGCGDRFPELAEGKLAAK
jgi:hypothetical protein